MKISVKQLRGLIKQEFHEARSNMRMSDVYSLIEYVPQNQSFKDRWGYTLPSSPSSMQNRDISAWLDNNHVETVEVYGKRMSARNFLQFLQFTQTSNVPVKQSKTIPVVRGIPVIKGRPLTEK
jgi:hypothetical protein